MNINFIPEQQVGRYSIDFFLPRENIAIEADGDYWHQDVAKDRRRDKYLRERGITTVRIKEREAGDINAAAHVLARRLWACVSRAKVERA